MEGGRDSGEGNPFQAKMSRLRLLLRTRLPWEKDNLINLDLLLTTTQATTTTAAIAAMTTDDVRPPSSLPAHEHVPPRMSSLTHWLASQHFRNFQCRMVDIVGKSLSVASVSI